MEDAGADEEQVALRQPQLAAQLCGGVYPEARKRGWLGSRPRLSPAAHLVGTVATLRPRLSR